ncbi:hypothetical protein FMUAM8_24840 [Nocardia cyriacigeorgica]|nr:hypothetical protein [Nocardia cyriacigeorgica]BDT86720.1 hypothetical protein FMUAM8_24840 [Nocardia cyriacigeorgica]
MQVLAAEQDTAFGEQVHGRFVEQLSVFDAEDTGFDRPAHRLGRVGMHCHVGVPIAGRVDGGAQLVECELGDVDRVVGRGGAAACGQLQLARAHPQVLPRRGEHFVAAVDDEGRADFLGPRLFSGEAA